ncbi:response regulator transcription factor [Rhizobium sp. FKL33]|uniref:response regulator transcription factor n=1 Tax=Rhizobium sp. FKL33 TaxID=2562307 RepID=UPI0010C001FA|nr:response regulator transcription factor [Rhizobium sp. FKL33]
MWKLIVVAERLKILIVDDDRDLAETLADYLDLRGGFSVRIADSGSDMKLSFGAFEPDAVVLDLHLKGENGADLAAWIGERAAHKCPAIVFLSGDATDFDRVLGLEIHGDEFLQKPVHPREILATLRSVLGRVGGEAVPKTQLVRLGDVVVDIKGQSIIERSGQERGLAPSEFALLRCFLSEPERVFSRDELLDLAPAGEDETTDRAIDRRIARLRRKIECGGPPVIRAVRGLGYRLERQLLENL